MPMQVVMGAKIQCSFGAPAVLAVLPENKTTGNSVFAANIMDFEPTTNIPTFGMCSCPANPEVASATTAAQGVLTPMPCTPVTTSPWSPGAATVTIGGQPALDNTSTVECEWGGVITITDPGQTTIMIP